MNPGLMDQRVTLEGKSVSRETNGEEVTTWATIATVWARAEVLRGREYVALRAAQSDITTRFTIRHRTDIDTACRVQWGSRSYSIVEAVPVPSTRPAYLELMAYAEVS